MTARYRVTCTAYRHRVGRGLLLLAVPLFALLSGCSHAPPPPPFLSPGERPALTFLQPHGPVAAVQRAYFFEAILLLLVVVVPVLVLTPLFAWRYRYGGSARYTPKWAFSGPLEVLIWGLPTAVVLVLAIWLWRNTRALDPFAPLPVAGPPLRVEVVGYDWKWLFIYPDYHVASIGEMAFPAGRQVSLDLTSGTVMQSFFIGTLGSQIYAMPGMVTHLHLLASAPGAFRGENMQFNGDGYFQQNFRALALSGAAFSRWIAAAQRHGIAFNRQAYAVITRRTTLSDTRRALGMTEGPNEPLHFTAVPPDLFRQIVRASHAGAAAEAAAAGGTIGIPVPIPPPTR